MGFRVLQLLIVGFWTVMTVLLVRSVVSDAGRFQEVPLEEFAQRVLMKRVHSPELVIFSDGVEVGYASVLAQPRGSGEPGFRVTVNGNLETAHLLESGAVSVGAAAAPAMRFTLSSWIDPQGVPERIDLRFRPRKVPVDVSFSYEPGGGGLHYEVKNGGEVVYSSSAGAGLSGIPVAALGLPLAGLPAGMEEQPAAGDGGGFFKAKHGLAQVCGASFSAYLLEVALPLGEPLRFVFSVSGELMAIENVPGHVVVSESFVPPVEPGEKRLL